jgi:hypothetical protein
VLTSARDHYRQQQRITALGLTEARRRSSRGLAEVARGIGTYQYASAVLAASVVADELAEQDIPDEPQGEVIPTSVITEHAATAGMLEKAESNAAFDRLVMSLIVDASRTSTSVAIGARPAVTGYVRALSPPSCGRCAVLAGRVYRYSTGFKRHPQCDCLMVPTNETVGPELVTDPMQAFRDGQIRGLSKADTQAIGRDKADIGQVVNVRRKKAGLTEGSSVLERGGRLTPAGIYRVASDRDEAIRLLRQFRYLT